MDFENIKKNYEIGNKIADAAAAMTDTKVTRKLIGTAAPRHFNRPIAEAAQANMEKVGIPQWTPDEQTFAKAVQKLADGKEDGLPTTVKKIQTPEQKPESGGSDDIGDVSWVAPTITLRYPSNIPNLPGHNWANAIAMATPIAHKGNIAGSKAVAMTMVDLLAKPELITAAKTYFTEQLKKETPISFLAENDQPQIQINRETMARFRPEMRKFYYDAARYDTYLEQLGIKFPALTKP
jgi:aminobenzoyl-glutamate utilization protein B